MSNNIDILTLHNKLISSYKKFNNDLNIYEKEYEKIEKILKKNEIQSHTKKKLSEQLSNLKSFISNIIDNKSLNYYLMESSDIIDEYSKSINKPITIDFMTSSKPTACNDNKQIIKQYISIYNKYNKKVIYNNNNKNCINCNNNTFDTIDNISICTNCGNSINILIQNSSFKDSERINIIPKYTYNRKSHFKDCINQYQGKQQSTIKDKVYNDLIKQFELNHLLVGDENTAKNIRFQKINKRHIQIFLKENKHSKHYEDINLIYHTLTGKKTNDISHLERQLIQDFEILTEAYDELFKNKSNIERKSFINSQYVLYQLLIRHKHPCDKQDFNILKTTDRQTFHDEICKELFNHLGWNFKCLF